MAEARGRDGEAETGLAEALTVSGVVVLATHNPRKIAALKDALRHLPLVLRTAEEAGCASPEEDGATILENAVIKARAVARATGLAALSDDSGFCISAIGDLPGPAAIDWAGPDKDFDLALDRVGAHLAASGTVSSQARFVSCVALALPDGTAIAEIGETHGRLVWPPEGPTDGYLSIFALPDETRSIAQLKADQGMEPGSGSLGFKHRDDAVHRLFARVYLGEPATPAGT